MAHGRMKLLLAALTLWLVLFSGHFQVHGAEKKQFLVLTNVSEIVQLSPEQAASGRSVRLTGIVTYTDPSWNVLFIRDASGGIFVSLAEGPYPSNNELVEITGRTGAGSFKPVVKGEAWTSLGRGKMPEPRRIERPDRFASLIDCEWSELVGVVRKVRLLDEQHVQIDVRGRDCRARVFLPVPTAEVLAQLNGLVDAEVRIHGVGGVDDNGTRGGVSLKLFIQNSGFIEVISKPAAAAFARPFLPLARLRDLEKTATLSHRIHVRGVVTYIFPSGEMVLQDEGGAVRINDVVPGPIGVGATVEAVGFVAAGKFSPNLEDAEIRPSATKLKEVPKQVPPGRVLWGDFDARLLEVSGALQAYSAPGTNHILTLLQDGVLFGVSLRTTNTVKSWEQLHKGDRVRVTGLCVYQGDGSEPPQSYQILLRSEDDLVYLSHLRLFSANEVLALAAAAATLWGAILLWGMTLRRKVSQQTEIIRTRLEKEAALEKRYQHLLENGAFPVMICHPETLAILYLNKRAADLLQSSANSSLTSRLSDYCANGEVMQQMLRDLQRGEAVTDFEMCFKTQEGTEFWALVCGNPIEFGNQPAFLLSFNDITARRQLEDRLRQSQKMEGIGHLAGGMAHEFNNILAGIMLSLELAQMQDMHSEARDLLQGVHSSCRRAADLIKQLLAFSRQSHLQAQTLDLTATVSGQINMLKRFLGERISLEFSHPETLPPVRADKSLIEQVVLNLSLNARDAMKNGGVLRLDLAETDVGEKHTVQHADARAGRFVCLSVADTGCGMDGQTMDRLFEPFFTTKDVGQGTGLGLATVRGIVQQHQGWVEVESHPGRGSTFRLYFPVADRMDVPVSSGPEETVTASGTVLIVEDDPSVRGPSRQLLASKGYSVLEAADGTAALAVWSAHRSEIDLIYTDMVMPGEVSGLQLSKQALAEKPELKVIITSGYNTDMPNLDSLTASQIVFLPKPCPPGKLLTAVGRCLQRKN
jgi:PAS domain S-box-containing protein